MIELRIQYQRDTGIQRSVLNEQINIMKEDPFDAIYGYITWLEKKLTQNKNENQNQTT